MTRHPATVVAWLVVACAPVPMVRADAQSLEPRPSPPAARLRGMVFDSVARAPLANAAVRVFRSDSAADGVDVRTDARGAFSVPGLRPGTWLLSFLHPRLDSLRLEPPLVRVEVVEAGEIAVTLAVPSAASLARALCGALPNDSTAAVVGDVRDASARRPVTGATVRATWPEWVFAKRRMEREDVTRVARSDSSGQFVLCGVPQGTTVRALAYREADTTGVVELEVPHTDYAVTDFVLDRTRTRRGVVRGVVHTPDGKAFPNAVARVLGSGTLVRTDSNGVFRIADAAAGTQTVELRALGYEPQRRPVTLVPGEPLALTFTVERARVLLDTVRVFAGRKLPPDVVAIERRWRMGQGVILDAATVRQRTSNHLTNALFAVPGVRLGMRNGFGNTVYFRGVGGECIPVIYLDGFRFVANGLSLDEIVAPDEVAAMEVYVRPMQRPAEFTDLADCGVLVVWTRYYLGNVPVFDPRRR
ncbi:carboxypeptidase regulatory-like domain-containing protein [Gemmatimonas sp.]|uniref:carboxypeptidase regulatory-like domain-containing protein n=1 Tax=Gemmatimonas sp. TaxID=1962908 RepID=UPI0025B93155|nr:carboxypeptidase regulatory-like domain-containing protein [Gemmatimonas sp.]MCA2992538.1 carboxypeptidase regulatory-like domain-containing protein [Gemmatimonas sp.]